jgi:ribose 5-phosphate isomerase A
MRLMRSLDRDSLKQAAAIYAVRFVEPGTIVGLGTGSTAIHAVREIARRHAAGELPGLRAFATSSEIARAAQEAGLPLIDAEGPAIIDVTIDGADEVDSQLNLIKGGGGALLHEKIVAQASRREIIVVDEAKMSPQLGTQHALPVEIIPFGAESQRLFLEQLGGHPVLRTGPDGRPFITDEGNFIYDCAFGPLADAEELAAELRARTGIVEHGLFLGMADDVIIAGQNGLRHLQRDPVTGQVQEVAVD